MHPENLPLVTHAWLLLINSSLSGAQMGALGEGLVLRICVFMLIARVGSLGSRACSSL